MKAPPGLEIPSSIAVCKLQKSLYGLKQASRQWYAKLSDTLRTLGFQHSRNDYSLFYKLKDNTIVLLAVYVDDIVITGNDPEEINKLKVFLDDTFKIKGLGELHYFLGMEIIKAPTGLIMTQRKFAMDLIKEFECDQLTATTSPLASVSKGISNGETLDDATNYRKLVGKLNYFTNTRPDIAFSVQYLSQFLKAHTQAHTKAALHTLRYIKKDPSQGLFFNNKLDYNLQAYCDSDWAQCPCRRRSVSG